jgi:hypothetical protein
MPQARAHKENQKNYNPKSCSFFLMSQIGKELKI